MIDQFLNYIRRGNREGIKELLVQGVDVNQHDSRGSVPLDIAALRGQTDVVVLLLGAGASPNSTSQYRNDSPLISAATEGHLDIVKLLLQAGADVQHMNSIGKTALKAAASGKLPAHLEIVRMLIEAGADVNVGNPCTVLMAASSRGSPAIVETLLRAGANTKQRSIIGSALIQAIIFNRPDNVRVLLEGGADPELVAPEDFTWNSAHKGFTPLQFAQAYGYPTIRRMLEERTSPAGTRPEAPRAPTDREAFRLVWQRIEAVARAQDPQSGPLLAPAAMPLEISQAITQLGGRIPPGFIGSYAACNGQLPNTPGLILPYRPGQIFYLLLSLPEVLRAWNGVQMAFPNPATIPPGAALDPGVKPVWWSRGWIPFAGNGGGDFLCLDLDPAKGGVRGQVIAFDHERPDRVVLAPSLGAFVVLVAEALERGDQCCR